MKKKEEDLLEEWQNAEPGELTFSSSASSVFSLRISRELLEEITRQAKAKNMRPTVYARSLLEKGVAVGEDAPLTLMTEIMNNIAHRLPEMRNASNE